MTAVASPRRGPVRRALAGQLRTAIRLDRSQSDPIVSLRNAIGIAAPLAVGALAGNAAIGLASTIGALQTAFADRPGPYRLRMLRMLMTALAAGITTALAVAFSRSDVAEFLLLLVIGVCAGLLIAFGPSAAQLGVAAGGSAIVLGHLPQSPSVAVHTGLLVFAGGAVQAALAVAAWPLRRHRPERVALAQLYRALAGVARSVPSADAAPPLGPMLDDVRRTLYGLGHDHGPSVEAYRVLLDEAERIRRELLLIEAIIERFGRDGRSALAARVRDVRVGAAGVLAAIAVALETAQPADIRAFDPLRAELRDLLRDLDDEGREPSSRAAAMRVRALSGQLRAALRSAAIGATEGGAGDAVGYGRIASPGLGAERAALQDALGVLRANLSPHSAIARHALRLGLLVATTDLVARRLDVSHGYWISLTVLVVLRPDFSATFQRGLLRAVGTVIGLLLATGLVHFIPGGPWYQIGLIAIAFFGMRLAGPGNVGLSALGLSALVVVLLSLDGLAPHQTIGPRALDTAIGAVLALAATLIWPVWERQLLPARLGELLAAYREYLAAQRDLTDAPERMRRVRGAARLARTNAEASVDRARAEPVDAARAVELGDTVLAHTHRFVRAVLALDTVRSTLRRHAPVPELDRLEADGVQVLQVAEQSIRSQTAPRSVPKLRTTQVAVAERLTRDPDWSADADSAALIIDATDRIANSLDTLVGELRRQSGGGSAPVANTSFSK